VQRRWLFSGSELFRLFDFWREGYVDENVFAYSNGQGSERALVVFHNRYADTDGWLHLSAAQATPGEEEQHRTTLAASLLVEGGSDRYCRFREQVTGLQYLLPADDLMRQGIHLRLGPYQHQVFWDFATLRDNADEPWGELCRLLGGTPVADLDRELIQVRHAPLIAAWDDLLAVCLYLSRHTLPLADSQTDTLAEPFARTALLIPGGAVDPHAWEQLQAQLALPLTADGETVPRDNGTAPLDNSARFERLLLMVWAVCRTLPAMAPESITSLGLDRPLARASAAAGEPVDLQDTLGPDGTVMLLQALLDLGGELPDLDRAASLLDSPWGASFVNLHESGGFSWFDKERFVLLVDWLLRLSAWREKPLRDNAQLRLVAAALTAQAEEAGYRLDRLKGQQQKPAP
jgi:hypothetical protein